MNDETKTLILGDHINTDDIIPANRCTDNDPEHLAYYALEHIIGTGNLLKWQKIKAGRNFGCGSSREVAATALRSAGIQEIEAESFAQIFYRNSINIGLPLEISGQSEIPETVAAITKAGGLFRYNQSRKQGQVALSPTTTTQRPMTLAEKLLARASQNAYVKPGEVIFVEVDLALAHDATTSLVAQAFYEHFGKNCRVWDKEKVILVADHFIQINDIRVDPLAPLMYQGMLKFAQEQSCQLLDMVGPGDAMGICHILLPEKGLIKPGMVVTGTDSHTCTYGAFGCFATGVGTTDMANIFAMGDIWLRVPETLLIELNGTQPTNVSAKDIMLFIIGQIGCDGAVGKVLEFRGDIIATMSMDDRMTLSNMAIECGAMCGLIAPDDITRAYVCEHGGQQHLEELFSDAMAQYERVYQFDLSNLEPQVARPPKPDQVVSISELGKVPITRAFIGSCTGGKLTDLAEAANVLRNRLVAAHVDLFVVPASQLIRNQAQALGYMDIFHKAGAKILKTGCGACINAGRGVLGENEVGISAINRNFQGRSGAPSAENYLASPRVVAASAVQGYITDKLE